MVLAQVAATINLRNAVTHDVSRPKEGETPWGDPLRSREKWRKGPAVGRGEKKSRLRTAARCRATKKPGAPLLDRGTSIDRTTLPRGYMYREISCHGTVSPCSTEWHDTAPLLRRNRGISCRDRSCLHPEISDVLLPDRVHPWFINRQGGFLPRFCNYARCRGWHGSFRVRLFGTMCSIFTGVNLFIVKKGFRRFDDLVEFRVDCWLTVSSIQLQTLGKVIDTRWSVGVALHGLRWQLLSLVLECIPKSCHCIATEVIQVKSFYLIRN